MNETMSDDNIFEDFNKNSDKESMKTRLEFEERVQQRARERCEEYKKVIAEATTALDIVKVRLADSEHRSYCIDVLLGTYDEQRRLERERRADTTWEQK